MFGRGAAPSTSSSTGRVRVIELIGPAGSGKSELARKLVSGNSVVFGTLSVWGLPFNDLLRSAIASSRIAWQAARHNGSGTFANRRAIAQMIRIRALSRTVDRAAEDHPGARLAVLDEGPVFAFAWLDVFYPELRGIAWRRWRRDLVAHWAARTDLIVRLDASDATLEQRIRTRAQEHMVKSLSSLEIRKFTAMYRSAFDAVLEEFAAEGSCRVVDMNTDDAPQHKSRVEDRASA